ncbi:retropepsin-like aspartic protease [Aquimarina sediminis]|uniref:retropepsin-like aspartic protease n=1 Tax=Aquimarina sediminis TaxID=2070536 RepID=UPI000CA00E80|nr:aspartyl protease family protein [Aquimarina sediminis]
MRNSYNISILTGILIFATFGCSIKWTEAIRGGYVVNNEIKESVDIEIHNRLIIVPVIINKKKYRFLFDTGAPFSISNKLQKENNFKIISKGNIVDSDQNRKKVNWAQVDSIRIGKVLFMDQTAFVGDFEANPLIKCLKIDGIIGSNLIRHGNWVIDQKQKTISVFRSLERKDYEKYVTIPFKTDHQYNIFVDINLGQSKVKNILVDYGSNGSIAMSNEIFAILKSKGIFKAPLLEKGIKQSGIIGNPVTVKREIIYSDSARIKDLELKNVLIKTGKTVSIGNQFLSRFKVIIDWKNKNLYFSKPEKVADRIGLAGFSLGTSYKKGVYVQSVIEESDAFKNGIRPNMKVVKIDRLDFQNGNDYCDYVRYNLRNEIFIQSIDSQEKRLDYYFKKTFLK